MKKRKPKRIRNPVARAMLVMGLRHQTTTNKKRYSRKGRRTAHQTERGYGTTRR